MNTTLLKRRITMSNWRPFQAQKMICKNTKAGSQIKEIAKAGGIRERRLTVVASHGASFDPAAKQTSSVRTAEASSPTASRMVARRSIV
jgi:hypothetical protein